MKHIKILSLLTGVVLLAGACSVKGPSLEEQFLANFNGHSSAFALDGKIMPIGEGGLKLENFKLASVQNSAEAIYAEDGFFPTPYKVVFVSNDKFLMAGRVYTLGNPPGNLPGNILGNLPGNLPADFPANLPSYIPGLPPGYTPSDTPETPEEDLGEVEPQFLARFQGRSSIIALSSGNNVPVTQGGRRIGLYRLISVQSATQGTYVHTLGPHTNIFSFTAGDKLRDDSGEEYTLIE